MSFAFDHLVVVVSDLARAIASFEAAGFSVTPGGRHDTPPTHNALIPFEHGGYLELLAFRGPSEADGARAAWEGGPARLSAIERRFLPRLLRGEGVADVALHGSDLRGLAAPGAGIRWSERVPMSRRRADGVRIEWELMFPDRDDLPFLIEDQTPRSLRVPSDPDASRHPNAALGIASVTFQTPRPAESARGWCEAFGAEPAAESAMAAVKLGPVRIAFVAGEPERIATATIRGIGGASEVLRTLGIDAALR